MILTKAELSRANPASVRRLAAWLGHAKPRATDLWRVVQWVLVNQ